MPLSFSFVAASLRPVYCTSFAQGERHPQTHHVIRELGMFNQFDLNDTSVTALCIRAFLLKILFLSRLWDYFAVLHARQEPL